MIISRNPCIDGNINYFKASIDEFKLVFECIRAWKLQFDQDDQIVL